MKTVRIPYKKVKNFILIKEVSYNIRGKYKKVTYIHEEYKNGELFKTYIHRTNKPAVIIYRSNHISEVQYWKFGILHRTYGPAIIVYYEREIGRSEWYHNGKKLTKEEVESEEKVMFRRLKILKMILKIRDKQAI